MIAKYIAAVSFLLCIVMYVPLFRRIVRRKHTRDISKPFAWMLVLLQANNGSLAVAEHAPYLAAWYVLQVILSAVHLALVYKYWDYEEPRHRDAI